MDKERLKRFIPSRFLSEQDQATRILTTKVVQHPDISVDDLGNLLAVVNPDKPTQLGLNVDEIDILERQLPTEGIDITTQDSIDKLKLILADQRAGSEPIDLSKTPTLSERWNSFREYLSPFTATTLLGATLTGLGVYGLNSVLSKSEYLDPAIFNDGVSLYAATMSAGLTLTSVYLINKLMPMPDRNSRDIS